IETEAARCGFGDLIVYFRQLLMHLPGALKTKHGLDLSQTLTLQKQIRAALFELSSQGKRVKSEMCFRKTSRSFSTAGAVPGINVQRFAQPVAPCRSGDSKT